MRQLGGSAKRGSYAAGFAYGTAGFAINALISLISAIVTARLYGAAVIGQYALSYAPSAAVWYLSTVREQPALVRLLATLEPGMPRVTTLFAAVFAFSQCLTIVIGAIVAAISYVVFTGPLHHPGLVAPAIVSIIGYVAFANPGWNLDTVFMSFRANPQLMAVRLHQLLVFLIAAILFSGITEGVWGLTLALALSYATSLCHRLLAVRGFLTLRVTRAALRTGFKALPDIVRFGLKMTPGMLAAGVSNEAGTWMLGFVSPVAIVGAWSRANTVSVRLSDINSRITDILLPTLIERRTAGDTPGFDRAVVDSMRYLAMILLLPAAAGGGAATTVMTFLFGPGFSSAGGALALLLLVPPVMGLSLLLFQVLLTFDRPVTTTLLETVRMIVTVGAGLALVAVWSATGMGVAILLGCAVELAAVALMSKRHLSTSLSSLWPRRAMAALFLAYALGFAASHFIVQLSARPVMALPAVSVGAGAYAIALLLFGGLLSRDRERLPLLLSSYRLRRSAQVS